MGIYLEDREVILAWGAKAEELRQVTHPDYHVQAARLTLVWNDRVFGLTCQVAAEFQDLEESLSAVQLTFKYPESIRSLPEGFTWLGERLAGNFGQPIFKRDDGETGEAQWVVDTVVLRHEYFMGMGGGHSLFIYQRGTTERLTQTGLSHHRGT
ncbi:MAG: hypothetical protein U0835_13985 [Isosphaeraceae bacterium]